MGIVHVEVTVTLDYVANTNFEKYVLVVIIQSLCELSNLIASSSPLPSMHLLLGPDKSDTHSLQFQLMNSIDPYDCGLYSTYAIDRLPSYASLSTTPATLDNSSLTIQLDELLMQKVASSTNIQFHGALVNWPSKTVTTGLDIYTYCCDPSDKVYLMSGEIVHFSVPNLRVPDTFAQLDFTFAV